jgi:hypothetical protein
VVDGLGIVDGHYPGLARPRHGPHPSVLRAMCVCACVYVCVCACVMLCAAPCGRLCGSWYLVSIVDEPVVNAALVGKAVEPVVHERDAPRTRQAQPLPI